MTEDSPTQATSGSEVFVSYASQDAAVANAIVAALEQQGLRCWVAPRDVRAGAHYADAIIQAINGRRPLCWCCRHMRSRPRTLARNRARPSEAAPDHRTANRRGGADP